MGVGDVLVGGDLMGVEDVLVCVDLVVVEDVFVGGDLVGVGDVLLEGGDFVVEVVWSVFVTVSSLIFLEFLMSRMLFLWIRVVVSFVVVVVFGMMWVLFENAVVVIFESGLMVTSTLTFVEDVYLFSVWWFFIFVGFSSSMLLSMVTCCLCGLCVVRLLRVVCIESGLVL